jgi:hypothetical protein
MGETCRTRRTVGKFIKILIGKSKEREETLEDLEVDGRTVLAWILKKQYVR